MVKTLPVNPQGRDFVVGDLHGCYTLLQTALANVSFDPTMDRLISVGDLVDRGPQSLECLQLLDKSWFYATMANHEDLMLSYLDRSPMGDYWFQNGGSWFGDLCGSDKAIVKQYCALYASKLPKLITLNMKDGRKFHVMHAELDTQEVLSDKDFADEAKFTKLWDEIEFHNGGKVGMWGRLVFKHLYRQKLDTHNIDKYLRGATISKIGKWAQGSNLSTVYVGHSVMREPTKVWNLVNLDTCAFGVNRGMEEAGLTICEPLTDTFWKTDNNGTRLVKPVIVA